MSLLDQNLILTEATAITSSTVLTNVYDSLVNSSGALITGSTGVGAGNGVFVVIKSKQAFAGGTNVTFNLRNSSTVDTNGALSGTVNTVQSSPAILTASLTANKTQAVFVLPPGGTAGALRYWDVQAVNSGTFTSGTFSAYITPEVEATNIPAYSISQIA